MSAIVNDADVSSNPGWSTQDQGAARVVIGEACPKPMGSFPFFRPNNLCVNEGELMIGPGTTQHPYGIGTDVTWSCCVAISRTTSV